MKWERETHLTTVNVTTLNVEGNVALTSNVDTVGENLGNVGARGVAVLGDDGGDELHLLGAHLCEIGKLASSVLNHWRPMCTTEPGLFPS